MWIPFLVFDNTEKNEATKVGHRSSFLKAYCLLNFPGNRGHRVDTDKRGRLYWKRRWHCWGDQHLWWAGQSDHFWASRHQPSLRFYSETAGVHKNIQMHLPAAAVSFWHTGLSPNNMEFLVFCFWFASYGDNCSKHAKQYVSHSGVYCQPDRSQVGDLGDGDHPQHPQHGLPDCLDPIHHHQLVLC